MGSLSPILLGEFLAALTRCAPPSGWPTQSKIAVANSGGPDSTCLLFLLAKLVSHPESRTNHRQLPQSVISLHVDHKLQEASTNMAARSSANAASLGVEHHTSGIPWGVAPFPPKPANGAFEKIAREARYQLIFDAMTSTGATIVAFGHHADDQLETSLMRLARGSTKLGAAGMRRCRRWGMGSGNSEGTLGWVGHRGLNRFIVRPLLHFQKDRILATCEANALDYINDPTNFQPELTLRNAIRHIINNDRSSSPIQFDEPSLPPGSPVSLEKIRHAASFLQSTVTDVAGVEEALRCAIENLALTAEYINEQVTSHLRECALPSPTGTLLLSSSQLSNITDHDVRFAIILRVMRYVSFHPWGSIRADGDRRQSGIRRIAQFLWTPDPQAAQIKRFTAGGGVLWTPAIFSPRKPLRVGNQCLQLPLRSDDQFCWLASRIPPFFKNPQEGAGSSSRLTLELTAQLRAGIYSDMPTDTFEVLYDCRFLLRIDPTQMPERVKSILSKQDKTVSIKVIPFTNYYWPKVVLQRESRPDQVLAVLGPEGTTDTMGAPPWISMQWVRLLDAT
ncbi:hypothetical protein PAXRUDRAFT_828154 [Paxillus rubicundulus Ve08.2h10]|uniref:tRNA(Ile)-lysidine synthetase n=1 Tax=Paxillus rubicundulus Ve08.2h10 TaxID=930991 RepID=A0A0D0E7S3_9AGAM|nr:hypothetical protein PAXRUDRAFT_828154 [Paxillus rubicundulus Ve08.2h10]